MNVKGILKSHPILVDIQCLLNEKVLLILKRACDKDNPL